MADCKWISVDERLPDSDAERVLMWRHNAGRSYFGHCKPGFDQNKRERIWIMIDGFGATDVTHWMPEPDPPEVHNG